MNELSSDTPISIRRDRVTASDEVDAVTNGAGIRLGLLDGEQAFELPARLFEQLPFAIYVCDQDGIVLRYNRRAAERARPWGEWCEMRRRVPRTQNCVIDEMRNRKSDE